MVELYKILSENNLTPNQFYLIYSMVKKQPPTLVNVHQEMRVLERDGWVKSSIIQSKSLVLIKAVENFFTASKSKSDKDLLGEEWNRRINQYQELFPKIKLPNGKAGRSDKKVVEDNFKWFFANYKYTWDEILDATRRYVNDYQTRNYKFMRTSQFFIRKQVVGRDFTSDLAEWCSNSDMEEEKNPFVEKIV